MKVNYITATLKNCGYDQLLMMAVIEKALTELFGEGHGVKGTILLSGYTNLHFNLCYKY